MVFEKETEDSLAVNVQKANIRGINEVETASSKPLGAGLSSRLSICYISMSSPSLVLILAWHTVQDRRCICEGFIGVS